MLKKIILLTSLLLSFGLSAQIEFSQKKWEIPGVLQPNEELSRSIEITNKSDKPIHFTFISTCSCLIVSPGELSVTPQETADFELRYIAEDSGEFIKRLIITSDSDLLPKAFFPVSGKVDAGDIQSKTELKNTFSDARIRFFYAPGCSYCESLIHHEFTELETRFPDWSSALFTVDNKENLDEVLRLQREFGGGNSDFPVLLVENSLFQGEKEIDRAMEELLEGKTPQVIQEGKGQQKDDLFLPAGILAAGLLDGINPCAFTSLIFLLSALSVAGKTKRSLLIIGLGYTAAVFVTYFLIGLGFWGGIQALFPFASFILNMVLALFLLVMAVLSLIDYLKIRQGKPEEMLLQLPDYFKKQIHRTVRNYTRSGAVLGGAILLGILVSLFELGCTGQIYLPTLTFMARNGSAARAIPLLILYNTAFILPLVLVFFLCYRGLSSRKLTLYFEKNLGLVKLLTFILFVLMGIFSIYHLLMK